jgi:Fur family ferric uptake transcriptional regulator
MSNGKNDIPEIKFLRSAGLFEPHSMEERAFMLFWDLDRHFTVEEFYRVLHKSGLQLPLESVGTMLSDLVMHGLAHEVHFGREKALRYEPLHIGEHHDHLICISCGGITEFKNPELEAMQSRAVGEKGFRPFRHTLQIFGVCAECDSKRDAAIPLTKAIVGEPLQIESCSGEKECVARLAAMGLREGQIVEVLSVGENAPVILLAGGARVGIGTELAENITVKPVDIVDIAGVDDDRSFPSQQGRRRRQRRHRKGRR